MELKEVFEETIYRVKKGDTVESIAEQFGVEAKTLCRANNLAQAEPGMLLLVPSKPKRFHKVMPQDTLESVAARYGVTPRELLEENGVVRIYTGLDLAIPG